MKKLSAQNDLMKIASKLHTQGYAVEVIKTHQDIIQYVLVYKSANEVYGIESSDTFEFNDEICDLPKKYFHIGCFEKYKGQYELWFFNIETNADDVIKSLEKEINCKALQYDSSSRIKSEFEKWKSKRQGVKWNS